MDGVNAAVAKIATVGVFDGVHIGHRWLIDRLRTEATRTGALPVVITFDRHPLALINPDAAPLMLMTVERRLDAIRAAGITEVEVLRFDNALRGLTAARFMTMLRERYGITAVLMGFNHCFGSDRLRHHDSYIDAGRDAGVGVVLADELPRLVVPDVIPDGVTVSSSAIRAALLHGDVTSAAVMLGHPFEIEGVVVGGRQIGRTLGFPTANIRPSSAGLIVPAAGVYASDVTLPDGSVHRAMVNIGVRPTVDRSPHPAATIEAHIIGWTGDLYGQPLKVAFLRRLRGERRFDSPEALARQLAEDRMQASEV